MTAAAIRIDPPWLAAARKDLGLKEIPGPASNPRILEYARKVGGWIAGWYKNDDTPWCAIAVGGWLIEGGCKAPITAAALDYRKYGEALATPSLGAILVFKRDGGGHVGLYLGEAVIKGVACYRVYGANQQNQVCEIWIPKERCVDGGIRWPLQSLAPKSGPITLAPNGEPLSTNEA